MVECESERYFKRLDFTNVLIDTWWNVNINNYDSHKMSKMF